MEGKRIAYMSQSKEQNTPAELGQQRRDTIQTPVFLLLTYWIL